MGGGSGYGWFNGTQGSGSDYNDTDEHRAVVSYGIQPDLVYLPDQDQPPIDKNRPQTADQLNGLFEAGAGIKPGSGCNDGDKELLCCLCLQPIDTLENTMFLADVGRYICAGCLQTHIDRP